MDDRDRTRNRTTPVTLGSRVLDQYSRFSLFNSPYPAHDDGCAIDCYPGGSDPDAELAEAAPSPVAGVVRETTTVRAPPKPYAADHDHLLLIDVEAPRSAAGIVARILHVEPSVEPGDRVAIGDPLGRLVRAGFFAPWVGTHLHVGFRRPDQHLHRATGSLPITLDVPVRPLAWNGTGTVVTTGETYAVLDAPRHPNPGSEWVAIAADGGGVLDGGLPHYERGGLLDGGLAHYERGGLLDGGLAHSERGGLLDGGVPLDERGRVFDGKMAATGDVHLNGDRIGVAAGRSIDWADVTLLVDDEPIHGLSLFCARDAAFGAKLICPDRSFEIGETVTVSVATR